jgi:hypothetical protein
VTSSWTARYPDLTGKAAIVAGDSGYLVEVVRGLAANGVLLAIVAAERTTVDDAVRIAEALDVAVLGMTAEAASPEVWERIAPHVEQRLGPIDIAVGLGSVEIREALRGAVLSDMAARRRGIVIEVGSDIGAMAATPGVRHRRIEVVGDAVIDSDVAAAVLFGASDTVTAPALATTLGL